MKKAAGLQNIQSLESYFYLAVSETSSEFPTIWWIIQHPIIEADLIFKYKYHPGLISQPSRIYDIHPYLMILLFLELLRI